MALETTSLIILAGGKGSRAGKPKGLIEFQGERWLARQLRVAATVGLARAVTVLGEQSNEYFSAFPMLDSVVNSHPELGPFSSLQSGLNALTLNELSGVFVLPVDVPCPEKKVFQSLHAKHLKAVVPAYRGKGGHPVFLSADFAASLLKLDPSTPEGRLDVQLRNLAPDEILRLELNEPCVTTNLNTPEDWQKFSAGRP